MRKVHAHSAILYMKMVRKEFLTYLAKVFNLSLVAMQDLKGWELWGDQLQNSGPDLNVASELGQVVAKMHWATSKQNVSPEYWEQLSRFRYVELH